MLACELHLAGARPVVLERLAEPTGLPKALDTRYDTRTADPHPLARLFGCPRCRWPPPAAPPAPLSCCARPAVSCSTPPTARSPGPGHGWEDRVDIVTAPCTARPAAALLIRPDGYLAWATDQDTPGHDGLRQALTAWFSATRVPAEERLRGRRWPPAARGVALSSWAAGGGGMPFSVVVSGHDGSAMSGDGPAGVVFPASADGRRSTSAVGRAVVADALREADPAGAGDAERDTNWRRGYAGALSPAGRGWAGIEGGRGIGRPGRAGVAARADVRCACRRRGDWTRQLALGTCRPAGDHGHGARHRAGRRGPGRCPTTATDYAAMRCCAGWRRGWTTA